MALQFRRGTDSDRLTITPTAGEPIWTTDTEKLYVGDGSTAGGIKVGNDSAEINTIIQNKLGNVSGNIVPDTDSAYDIGSPTNKFRDLYLSGNSIYLGDNLILRNDAGTLVAEDSSETPVSISLSNNTTSDLAEGTNLYYTTARADSDAKNAISASGDLTYNSATGAFSVTTYKSADFNTDLGTKTTANLTEGSNLYFTNARADARVTATADSAYVQARQIKYTNADFADSSFVTTQINNLIDGAPGTLDTLNEIAAALNDDDSAYSTLVGLINAKSDLDSTDAIALIDSAYVQARQTTYDFLDSSEAIALIDSAYVQARQTSGGGFDSATAIALIDSSYVQVRQVNPVSAFTTISVSGQSDVVADNSEAGIDWVNSSSQQQKLTASDAATNDRFGYDLDISGDGDYAIVAAPWESTQKGKAYVYLRSGSTWSEQATLTGSDTGSNDYFGIGIKISEDGSTAVVGAKGAGTGINGTGKAYVFVRSGTSWTQQAAITASDAADGDLFGSAVDISDDGNTIVFGAYGEDTGGNARGQAYVFTRSGSTWTEQQKFQSSDIEDGDNFGFAVAISGDGNNLIVGVPFEDTNGSGAGSAYIFTRSGSTWSQQAKIQASDAAANQEFAYSVDMSTDGNTVAIGSRDDTGGTNRGAAYIFTRSGSTWSQQAKIEDTNEADFDLFAGGGRGVSLSGSGNVLVVGAYGDDDSGSQSGSSFVFTRSGSTWSLAKKIATSDAAASDENGFAVAIDKNGDTLLTGSYGKSSSTGAAYVFVAPEGTSLNDKLTLEAGSGITITTNASTDTITITGSAAGNDSATTIALIDSSYVQARQIKYTNADFTDSAFVTTQINNLIDAAPGALDTLNELAAAIGDDANFSTTITNQIAGKLDSAQTTALIDSAYVQARQTSGGGFDSATAIALIDSDYVQVRQLNPVSSFTTISVNGQSDIVADNSEGGASWSTSTETGDLFPNDNVSSGRMGWSTDISDDGLYVVSGAPQNTGPGVNQAGRAFIHYYNGSSWSVQQRLDPPSGDVVAYLNYGWAVAIDADGNTAAVSARNSNTHGRVYVYTRSGTSWTLQQTLAPTKSQGYFGISVDISEDGNMITVGHQDAIVGSGPKRTGAVEIFTRSGSTWSSVQLIEENNNDFVTDAKIGWSNELASEAKDRVVFGALTDKSAWVWVNSGGWSRESELTPSNTPSTQNESYGHAVSINADGTVAAVSDPGADGESSETKAGNVYIFTRSGSTWTQQQRLYSASQTAGDFFGHGLNLSGDGTRVFIGVSRQDASPYAEGEVQIWKNTGGTWALESTVNSSDTASNENNRFAAKNQSVAVTKDAAYLAVGALEQSLSGSILYTGATYVYTAAVGTSLNDKLTLEAGSGITITTNATTDTITITGSAAGLDSAGTIALIDSSYVQARQTTYTNADFADSAYVTTQINSVIDAAPGALDTLNELAAALGDDANFSTTITNQIAGKLDSAATTSLIDSAYVQARAPAGGNDSATTIALIDSSYVQARQTTPIPTFNKVSIAGQGDVVADADAAVALYANLTQQAKLTASDAGANDFLGYSVNVQGDYALVGARGEKAAYVFTRSGTTWTQQAKLTNANSNFGVAVALSADTNYAIVGSQLTNGEAHVFLRSGTSWALQATLQPSDRASNDEYGTSVSISSDGTYAVIGGMGDDSSQGAAVVFIRSGTSWSQQQKITEPSRENGARFGAGVRLNDAGNVLVCSSPLSDESGQTNAGAVFVFTRSGTTWSWQADLVASDAGSSDYMGDTATGSGVNGVTDINENGTLVVAGAYGHNNGGVGNAGAVYVWKYSGSSWSQVAKLNPPSNVLNENYGEAVAISGNTIVVGQDNAGGGGTGAKAYVYTTEDESTWTIQKTFAASDIAAYLDYGFSVAIDEAGTIIVGAPGTANQTGSTGQAYVFTAPMGVMLEDTLTLEAGSGITLTTNAATDTVTITGSAAGVDSAATINLIDSAYVQARQVDLQRDSAFITNIVDSSYVQARQTSSITSIDSSLSTADSAQVIDSFAAATYRTTKYIAQLTSAANVGYTNWPIATEQQIITGSEAGAPDTIGNGDEFGRGIAIGSNKLLVGSTRNDYGTTNAGAAVYYTRDSAEGTWTYQQWVQPSSPGASDFFGQAIAADSAFDTIAVTGHTEGLFILDRSNDSDNTTWSQTYKVIPSTSSYNNAFQHVAISKDGETAITGSHYDTTEKGKAYIYATDSSGASKAWSLEATLTASNAGNYDFFGKSLALNSNGNIALVAATQEDTAGSNAGAVYAFRRTASNFLLDFTDIGKGSGQYNAWTGPSNSGRDQGFKSMALSSPVTLSEPHGMDLHPDGTKVFITSNANQSRIAMWTMSTAYDMQTASYTNSFSDVDNEASAIKGIKFNPDGTKLFVANSTAEADSTGEHAIFQYDLSTAYDLTTASYANKSINIGTTSRAQDIQFNLDGTKMFVLDDDNNNSNGVREYTLSTAYDISTASYVDLFNSGAQEGSPRGLTFNLDGTKMYVSGNNSDKIFQYSLTTAFDVSTASYDNTFLDAQYETNQVACHRWRDDGSQVFFSNTNQEGISTYYTKNATWAQDSDFLTVSGGVKLGDQGALAISTDGSYIYAGSYGETVNSLSQAGAVHVWRDSSGSGTYTYDQKLVASDPATNAGFGSSLALDGNNLIIGAEGADTYGGAYIFTQGTDGSWTQRKKVSPSDGTAAANKFGGENAVAISGKDVAVGAWNYPTSSKGRAYVYNTTGANAEVRDKGYHSEEILLTHNGTNVAMTGYAKILLDSDLGTFDAVIADSGSNVKLTLSPTYAGTTVKLKAIRTEV